MRKRTNHIIDEWQIPRNPNGRLWKRNKSFNDMGLQKIIDTIEINEKVGNVA